MGGAAKAHYAAGGLYEKDPSTGATKKYYRVGGRLVAVRDSSLGLKYLHQDHLGSTSLQTTSAGAYDGHEFRGPFGQPLNAGGSLATDLKYTDQRSLEASLGSLYHYQSRWYSPILGKFLQPDSIVPGASDPQNFNRYAYVRSNPLRYVDPTGHDYRPGDKWTWYKTESDGSIWWGQFERFEWGDQFVPYDQIAPATAHTWDAKTSSLLDDAPVLLEIAGLIPGIGAGPDLANAALHFAKGDVQSGILYAIAAVPGLGDGWTVARHAAKHGDYIIGPHRELVRQGVKDSHHVVQEAAVEHLARYDGDQAIAIGLRGPAYVRGTPHHAATQVQRRRGGGTFASELDTGYDALVAAGVPQPIAWAAVAAAEEYFASIGVSYSTSTRIPGNRRR